MLVQACDAVVATPAADRNAEWAAGVAALAWPSVLVHRADIQAAIAATIAILDDPRLLAMAHYALAMPNVMEGDLTDLRSLARNVIGANDLPAIPHTVGTLLAYSASFGYFEEANNAYDQLRTSLDAAGLPFTCETAKPGHYGAINLLLEQGRLHEARTLIAPVDRLFEATCSQTSAAAAMILACALGDLDLVNRVERWVEPESPPFLRGVSSFALAAAARARGQHELAGSLLAGGLDPSNGLAILTPHPAASGSSRRISHRYRRAVCILAGAGRLAEATAMVAALGARINEPSPPPLPHASWHYTRALLDYLNGDLESALEDADQALQLAETHGFTLLRIEALELIAASQHHRGRTAIAARILGATAAHRRTIGYREYLVPNPTELEQIIETTSVDHAAEFKEGAGSSLDDITNLARRGRGKRKRPLFGWASLTPTETAVAGRVATGMTNDEIAQALTMSVATVKTHLVHIYTKLGTSSRAALAAGYTEHARTVISSSPLQ